MKKIIGWGLVLLGLALAVLPLFKGGITVKEDAPVNSNLAKVGSIVIMGTGLVLMAIGGTMIIKE